MATSGLDQAGRPVGHDSVEHSYAAPATVAADGGLHRGRLQARGWVVPVIAATALVGVTAAVWIASQRDAHAPAATADSPGTTGSILGSWRLVAASVGHPVRVSTTPGFIVTFQADDTAVILTGINAITVTVRYEPGAVTARFRLTTAAFDGSTDPDRRAVLGLLDSLAPAAAPPAAVRSTYRIDGDHLRIRVPAGTLDFTRIPAVPAGSGSTASSPAAPAVVRPS